MVTRDPSSLINSVTMTLLLECERRVFNPAGYADTQRLMRQHAQEIVDYFLGSLYGGWRTNRDFPAGSTIGEKIAAKVLRDLHRWSGTAERVDAYPQVAPYVIGLISALIADWPHKTKDGRPLAAL